MDAKSLGLFIAARRKKLGLTQASLARRLHVTDKAVSRWERGVGLPDIGTLEPLAIALEVSLVDLMQAKCSEKAHLPTTEAELLLTETLRLSSNADRRLARLLGGTLLICFAVAGLVCLTLLVFERAAVLFPVGSIVAGLLAWGIPVWRLSFGRGCFAPTATTASLSFALLALMFQFFDLAANVREGDWAAIEDTFDALLLVVLLFLFVTLLLNLLAAKRAAR